MKISQHFSWNTASQKALFPFVKKRAAQLFGIFALAFLPTFLLAAAPTPIKKAEPPTAGAAISASLMVVACDPVDGGDLKVTFRATLQNTGSTVLSGMTAFAPMAAQFGGFFRSATGPVTFNNGFAAAPTANAGFNGLGSNELFVASGTALPGQSYTFLFDVIVNPNALNFTPNVQILARAYGGAVVDESDIGSNPSSSNPSFIGDLLPENIDLNGDGNPDDDFDGSPATGDEYDNMTPVPMTRVSLTKEQINFEPSPGCVPGNYDVTFRFILENTGNLPMDRLQITDNLVAQIGNNFVQDINIDVVEPLSTAFILPVINNTFDGGAVGGPSGQSNLFDGTSGYMTAGQRVVVDLIVRLNVEVDGLCSPTNDATATVRPGVENFPGDLTPFIMPDLSTKIIGDFSDAGNVPDGVNLGFFGDTGDEDDPTIIEIPDIRSTLVQTNFLVDADPCSNNVTICFEATVKNTGNVALDNVAFGLDFEGAGIGTPVGLPTITALTPFTINAAYAGTTASSNTVGAGVSLTCGQSISMEVCAVFDPSVAGDLLVGQASATANLFAGPVNIFDFSDSGTNPDGTNDLALGATLDCSFLDAKDDDLTPVLMPRLKSNKLITTVTPAASGLVGNFDVRYEVGFFNTGNVNLVNLQINDDLVMQLGAGFVGMTEVPNFSFPGFGVVTNPVFNPGFGINPMMTGIFDGTSGELAVGGSLVATFVVEIDADLACAATNQMLGSANAKGFPFLTVDDLSDGGTDPFSPNAASAGDTGGCDDPTPIELPDVHLTKRVVSATEIIDPTGCTNQYTVVYEYIVENTGNLPIDGVQLFDQLNDVANLGAGYVSASALSATGPAAINGGYNGTSAAVSIITATGPLACGDQIVAQVTSVIDADLTPFPAFNQATVTGSVNRSQGLFPPVAVPVDDASDSGDDPDSANDAAPGATDAVLEIDREDDPTPVYLPKIKASKEVVACGPSASGTLGNMDVTVRFVLLNTGNVPLDNICLTDDIALQMGLATLVSVTPGSFSGTATILPDVNQGYTGGAAPDNGIFDCTSGLIMPDETVSVDVVFEINPNAAGFVLPALNQATVVARALDFDLIPVPAASPATVSDISDGGSNPNGPNMGYPGNTGGCDDKTPISLPQLFVAKEAIACVPSGLTLPGEFDYTFRIRIQNTGNVRLQNVSAIDDLSAQITLAYLSKVGATTVSTANNAGGIDPTVNAAYAGSGNLLQPLNLLMPGAVTTITWTARINPNALLPNSNLSNQVFSSAIGWHPNVVGGLVSNQIINTPGTAVPKPVNDLSDSGSIPESYNVGEPGDMSDSGDPLLGEDDPTPIEIPSLNIAKSVIACTPTSDTEPGMFDVTFRINVENTGNVHLDSLRLDDSFLSLGAAFKGFLEKPKFVNPPLLWLFPGTFNTAYNGTTDADIFNDEFNELQPGEKFSIEFKIKIDPNAILPITAMCNQARVRAAGVRADGTRVLIPRDGPGGGAQKRTLDFSDSGLVPESTNPNQRNDTGIHDNCTPIEIPSINVAKYVTDIIKVPGEVPPGNARLTFEIKAQNTGNVDLRNTQLIDSVRTMMGATWVNFAPGGQPTYVTTGAMATTVPAANRPVLNQFFTGIKGAGANIFNGTSGIIQPGQFVTIRMTVDLDPNAVGAPDPLKNQAFGSATGFIIDWTQIGTPVPTPSPVTGSLASNAPRTTSDLSDSGKIPESNNIGEPCDKGTHNDPTPFEIPFNLASKWEVPNQMGTNCAWSEIDGNMDIVFHIKYVNVGNTWLRNLRVVDDLMMQFGPNFVKVHNAGIDVIETESNATELPTLNWLYDGKTNTDILVGTDGLLAPNEFFTVSVLVEINPNAVGTIKPYDNQGVVYGLAVREDGTKVFYPCTTNDFIWNDRTDAGELPETTGPGYPGDTGGSNDPYDFRLPMSTAFAQDLIIYPNCITGIDEYLIPWVEANGGAVVMAHPDCGPIEWSHNFMGSLDWLPAEEYGCGCTGIWEIEWNAKDQCGHDVCHDAFVEIKDTAAPCWDMDPMDIVVLCGAGMQNTVQEWLDAVGGGWFLDNCSASIDVWNSYNPATVNACDEDGSAITFYLRDACGNTSSRRANLKIIDEDAPVFTNVPANITMTCGAPIPPPANVIAVDDCTASPIIKMTETIVAGNCPGTSVRTRTWSASDFCGNSTTAQQTITIVDDAKPGFTSIPANLTITCPAVPVFGTPTATDICSGSATITFSDAIIAGVSCPGGYTVRRTWTAADLCGNTRSVARTIRVLPDPNNVPSILTMANLPSDTTINCDGVVGFNAPTATSNCSNSAVTFTFSDATTPGSCTVAATFTRTWTATDACGSTATAKQKVTRLPDNEAPVFITVPQDVTVLCSSTATFGVPTFSDNCTASPVLTQSNTDIGGLCSLGNTNIRTRTWTARDQCNNTSTARQVITRMPNSPTMAFATMPAEQVVSCSQPVIFTGQPTATSNCPTGQVTFTFVDNLPTGGGCADAVFTRTWTATDGCGNSIQGIQIVTQTGDAIDPNFVLVPSSMIVDCSNLTPTLLATGADNCSNPAITFSVETLGSNPCAAQWANAAMIHWTATDGCGNEKTATSPAFTAADIFGISFLTVQNAIKTYACGEAVEWTAPTCITGCPANNSVKVTHLDTFGGDCATGKTVTRTWTATDDCGHLTSTSLTQFMAPDMVPPTISIQNANEILPCGSIIPTITPDADDNCLVESLEAVADISNGNELFRTWMATDACGNTTTAVQKFTFLDNESPVFTTIPANVFVTCENPSGNFGSPAATDACGLVTITSTDFVEEGSCAGNYKVIRIWTATDQNGNTTTAEATLFVTDTDAPVFAGLPTDAAISCDGVFDFGTPTASDCSGASIAFSDALTVGTCTGDYIITRTWTASDGCGNVATAAALVELKDDIAPVFSNLVQDQTMTWAEFQAFQTAPTATDNCSFAVIPAPTKTQEIVDCEVTEILTWTATDDCGNTAEKAIKIDISDEFPNVTAAVPTNLTTGQTVDFPTSQAGGIAPFTFMWTITGQNWSIVGGEGTSKPTVLAGSGKAFLTLSMTNGAGCSSLFTWDMDATTTSVNEAINGVSFDLFPVPTADFSTLECTLFENEKFELRLTDAAGKQLETRTVLGKTGLNKFKIDLTPYAAGSYLLEVRSERGAVVKPIIKQ